MAEYDEQTWGRRCTLSMLPFSTVKAIRLHETIFPKHRHFLVWFKVQAVQSLYLASHRRGSPFLVLSSASSAKLLTTGTTASRLSWISRIIRVSDRGLASWTVAHCEDGSRWKATLVDTVGQEARAIQQQWKRAAEDSATLGLKISLAMRWIAYLFLCVVWIRRLWRNSQFRFNFFRSKMSADRSRSSRIWKIGAGTG